MGLSTVVHYSPFVAGIKCNFQILPKSEFDALSACWYLKHYPDKVNRGHVFVK